MPKIHFTKMLDSVRCDVLELVIDPPGIDFEGSWGVNDKPVMGFVPWTSVAFVEYEPNKIVALVTEDAAVGGTE